MRVMGFVLGPSLMAISIMGILLYLPCIMYYGNGFVVAYKHFDKSLHIGSLDPTCL